MNHIMGILPMKHGQDGHYTKEKFILLEALSYILNVWLSD
jgi:hypothetical protein